VSNRDVESFKSLASQHATRQGGNGSRNDERQTSDFGVLIVEFFQSINSGLEQKKKEERKSLKTRKGRREEWREEEGREEGERKAAGRKKRREDKRERPTLELRVSEMVSIIKMSHSASNKALICSL
jgi:hypothetical protein